MTMTVVQAHCPMCGAEAIGVTERRGWGTELHRLTKGCEHAERLDAALADVALEPPVATPAGGGRWARARDAAPRRPWWRG